MIEEITDIIESERIYNLHSHTQFCDGKEAMERIADAACSLGFSHLGFTPHSPLPIESPCNMPAESVNLYLDEIKRLQEKFTGKLEIYSGMEIDFLSRDFGPHIDYFQKIPLDYRLGSVHFVPSQEGRLIDCDGSAFRFQKNLKECFKNDLRYVVEKYLEQVMFMIEFGGFDMLGHLDKIAQNAVTIDPEIETYGWYASLIEDIIKEAKYRNLIIEINTKYFFEKNRFFPDEKWWNLIKDYKFVAVNSDAHHSEKLNLGRNEAFERLQQLK